MIWLYLILFGLLLLGLYPVVIVTALAVEYLYLACKRRAQGQPLPAFPSIPLSQLCIIWCGVLLDIAVLSILREYHIVLLGLKVAGIILAVIVVFNGVLWGPPLLLWGLMRLIRRHGPDKRSGLSL
jgi:hypothetical protein